MQHEPAIPVQYMPAIHACKIGSAIHVRKNGSAIHVRKIGSAMHKKSLTYNHLPVRLPYYIKINR